MVKKKATKDDILKAIGNKALRKSGHLDLAVKKALELVGTEYSYDNNPKVPDKYRYKDLNKKIAKHYYKEDKDRPMNLKELIEAKKFGKGMGPGKGKGDGSGIGKGGTGDCKTGKKSAGKGKGYGTGICKGASSHQACLVICRKETGGDFGAAVKLAGKNWVSEEGK